MLLLLLLRRRVGASLVAGRRARVSWGTGSWVALTGVGVLVGVLGRSIVLARLMGL